MYLITNYTEFPDLVEKAEGNTFTYEPGVVVLNLPEMPEGYEYQRSRLDEASGFMVGSVRKIVEPTKPKRATKKAKAEATTTGNIILETESTPVEEIVYPKFVGITSFEISETEYGARTKRIIDSLDKPTKEAFFKDIWKAFGKYPVFVSRLSIMPSNLPKMEEGVPVMLIAPFIHGAMGIPNLFTDKYKGFTVTSFNGVRNEDRVITGSKGIVAQANDELSTVYFVNAGEMKASTFLDCIFTCIKDLHECSPLQRSTNGAYEVVKPMIDKAKKEAATIEKKLTEDIESYSKMLFEANASFQNLMATKERIIAGVDQKTALIVTEIEKIQSYPDISKVYLDAGRLVVETKAMWSKLSDGHNHLLGRFRIAIDISNGYVTIQNFDFMNARMDYPHQLNYGTICWGSNTGELVKLLGAMQIAAAVDFMCAFISAPNTKDSAGVHALRYPIDDKGKFKYPSKDVILVLNPMISEGMSVEAYNDIYA